MSIHATFPALPFAVPAMATSLGLTNDSGKSNTKTPAE